MSDMKKPLLPLSRIKIYKCGENRKVYKHNLFKYIMLVTLGYLLMGMIRKNSFHPIMLLLTLLFDFIAIFIVWGVFT